MLTCYGKITVPITISNVIGQLIFLVNAIFAGQMNDEVSLAAVGLGDVITSILVLTFLIGLNNTQETLTSQAFGSGQLKLCGVYLNRGRLIVLTFYLPLALLLFLLSE